MATEDWELTPEGMVKLAPVTDWRIASMGLVAGLRLSTAHLKEGQPVVLHLQIGLPPDEARRLGEALCLAADCIEGRTGEV
jgi:hypothetical protein